MKSIEELQAANGGRWGTHPKYPVQAWQYLVANNITRRGYWEWVQVNLEEDAGLMVRHLTKAPEEIAGVALAGTPSVQDVARSDADWSDYHEWQTDVRAGRTKLPFEEWKKNYDEARKMVEYAETQAKERHGK